MKIGIMQPYFLPYLGYFQLIAAVDRFVVYDDVRYINGGWINHNFIWSRSGPQRIVMPLLGRSQNLNINQIQIIPSSTAKLIKTLEQTYSKAPHFAAVMPVAYQILLQPERQLGRFLLNSLSTLCDYLGLRTQLLLSSDLPRTDGTKGQDRIIDICCHLGGTEYLNPSGGISLYESNAFALRGIRLAFLIPRKIHYAQFGHQFVPNLSILDVLMFNDRQQSLQLLREFDLLTPPTQGKTNE